MSFPALTYICVLVATLAIDAVWLSLTGSTLYRSELGDLLMDGFRPLPAILFYLIYVAGIVVFVVRGDTSPARIAARGALFGVVCYATYDLTNYATLAHWSLLVTLADMAWGAVLTAAGSTLGSLAARRLVRH